MINNRNSLKQSESHFMLTLLLPAVVFVLIVTIVPLLYTFILSFHKYNLLKSKDAYFNGIDNYIKIFKNSSIRHSLWVTFLYSFLTTTISVLIGVSLAVVVNKLTVGKSVFRIIFLIPMMLSGVVVGVLWRFLFNTDMGVINYLIEIAGFKRVNWISTPTTALISIIIAEVWQWSSYTFVNALASLESLNPEPIEAAEVDGANAIQTFFYIKLPSMMPVIMVCVVFRVIGSFRSFDMIYSLTKGGPGNATQTMAIGIFKLAFDQYDIGTASALSVIMFVLLMGISIFLLKTTLKKK